MPQWGVNSAAGEVKLDPALQATTDLDPADPYTHPVHHGLNTDPMRGGMWVPRVPCAVQGARCSLSGSELAMDSRGPYNLSEGGSGLSKAADSAISAAVEVNVTEYRLVNPSACRNDL